MDYVKKAAPSSSTAKTALGFGIAGTALAALSGGGGGVLGNLLGGPRPLDAATTEAAAVSTAVLLAGASGCNKPYVTEKEMVLIRENSGKDATIARLEAEKYADSLVKSEVEPLKTRVCALETAAAVNAARDRDFRHYVEREFVHQPKACIRESIVVCKDRDCCCCDGERTD